MGRADRPTATPSAQNHAHMPSVEPIKRSDPMRTNLGVRHVPVKTTVRLVAGGWPTIELDEHRVGDRLGPRAAATVVPATVGAARKGTTQIDPG